MDFNECIAHVTCGLCSKNFQVLTEDGSDWVESETVQLSHEHTPICPQNKPLSPGQKLVDDGIVTEQMK